MRISGNKEIWKVYLLKYVLAIFSATQPCIVCPERHRLLTGGSPVVVTVMRPRSRHPVTAYAVQGDVL